jgi:alkanesulfonate monooxygenase SsuD/methylene tetrahydromethanopterin reductase-like flavin-dependent oxidoreductase (luciferase family)
VAEEYAMLDVISNGRLEFGVGRGSTPREFEEIRISTADSAVRLRESTELIRRAWADDPVTFHGELFEYENVRVLPKPVQQPHPPIWVGASRSDDTFRWAGEQGFHLLTLPYMYEPSVLQHWVGIYRESLLAAGHDPATREILGKFHIYVTESNDAVLREAEPYLAHYERIARARTRAGTGVELPRAYTMRERHDFAHEIATGNIIAGDPDRCIETIRHWQELAGLTSISGTFYFGGLPQELALRNIRLFAEHVMPHPQPLSQGGRGELGRRLSRYANRRSRPRRHGRTA